MHVVQLQSLAVQGAVGVPLIISRFMALRGAATLMNTHVAYYYARNFFVWPLRIKKIYKLVYWTCKTLQGEENTN